MSHRAGLRWLLVGAVLLVHRTAAPPTPSSRRTAVVVSSDGRTTRSGYSDNPTIDLFKRIHQTHIYHRELLTSNIAKLSNTTTDYTEVNTIGTVWYKRRYTTTASRLTEFPLNWVVKRIPLMCSCAVSKRSTRPKLSTTINPNSTVTDRITTVTRTMINNVSSTEKMTENDLRQTTTSPLSTRANSTNPTFTNQITHRNQSTTRYVKNDTSKGRSDFKETISTLKKLSSSVSTTKGKKHTVKHSHRETKRNTDNHKRSNHPLSSTLLVRSTKKRNPIKHTKRYSDNSMVLTDDSVCTKCSKPIFPIHTLIKTKPTTTSQVNLKSSQTKTTTVATQLNKKNVKTIT